VLRNSAVYGSHIDQGRAINGHGYEVLGSKKRKKAGKFLTPKDPAPWA